MKTLLLYLVKNLVQYPEKVKVSEENKDGLLILHLSVDPSDMGRVIGKEGKIIKALRALLHIRAAKENLRFSLDLKETTTPA